MALYKEKSRKRQQIEIVELNIQLNRKLNCQKLNVLIVTDRMTKPCGE